MEVMPGYKQTEVGIFPEDWTIEPLDGLGKWLSGGTPSMSEKSYWDGSIPWVSPKDMKVARLYDASDHISERALTNGTRLAPQNALLIVVRGMILAHSLPVARAERSLAFNQDIKALVARDSIDSDYLLWWFQAHKSALLSLTTESTHGTKRLPSETFLAQKIALPPLPEQEAIAGVLSKADAITESYERLIAKKRLLKKGVMQQLLSRKKRLPGFRGEWKAKRLGDVAEIIMGQSPSSKYYNDKENGLPLIQGNADISDRKTIKRVYTTEITKRGRRGDILMSVRAPVGEISRAVFDVCIGRGVCAIRYPNDFLYHYLIAKESTWAKLSKGSTFDSVNSTDVKTFEVKLPTDEQEQTAIATFLSAMDAEIALLEAQLAKYRQLKQGLMHNLLTGRVRLVGRAGIAAPQPAG